MAISVRLDENFVNQAKLPDILLAVVEDEIERIIENPEIGELKKANDLILYNYLVRCMKELAKAEPDIDALLPWNFKH
ncbi:type II toxin-antitoxin system RelE/ParE family toxin [Vibrio sp. SS-MA-C1-2]|uniref:type II toxin-antitoxin system RelE/ParE family toxin n=1 Tax=Vibrio sp. SS-MA-C1-2 TaxID=2908646 RepID=UPI001F468E45|nr:type II toxin-antitoxin system RelE/ParE family toxin [Vibrio sp. SS-MA-C1-2]UJF17672.1 type II toxin-antitoxin system RelE/ParE family toxin [Vibrio sp. SS-MA-C1-2]